MSTMLKILAVVGAVIVVGGMGVAALGAVLGGAVVKGQKNTNSITKDGRVYHQETVDLSAFSQLVVNLDVAEIDLQPSPNGEWKAISLYTDALPKPEFIQENGKLVVNSKPLEMNLIPKSNQSREITIYYPQGTTFESVEFTASAIEVDVQDLSTKNLVLDAGAGSFNLKRVQADTARLDCNAAEIELVDCRFLKMSAKAQAGDIEAEGLYTQELDMNCNAASVKLEGELLGESRIEVNMGDIELELYSPKESYTLDLSGNLSDITIDGKHYTGSVSQQGSGANKITGKSNAGAISLEFR